MSFGTMEVFKFNSFEGRVDARCFLNDYDLFTQPGGSLRCISCSFALVYTFIFYIVVYMDVIIHSEKAERPF